MEPNNIVDQLKKSRFRMTKARKDILKLLSKESMDIHRLSKKMFELGHPNSQTIYNNIKFLENQKMLYITLNNHKKIYHLLDANIEYSTKLKISCNKRSETLSITQKDLINQLSQSLGIKNFKINCLNIEISGICKHLKEETCKNEDLCTLDLLKSKFNQK